MWEKIGQHHHGASGRAASDVVTDTDLSEAENVLTYSLELPGMDENNVEVAVEAGRLSIRGEKRDEREEKGANYVFKERRFGSFERIFALPANAEEDNVKAGFSKGVLTVTIPCKSEGGGDSRKIEVTTD
jgi:HSP20 family protein